MNSRRLAWNRWLPLFAIGLVGVLSGCSEGAPFKMAPASGTVKFKDGSVPQGAIATINFDPDGIPSSGKMTPQTATGTIEPDGKFTLKTYDQDGAAVGKHKVRLQVLKTYPGNDFAVHAKYSKKETTPLVAEVTAAGPNDFKFEVDKP